MMILTRYLVRSFLARFIALLAGMLLFLQSLDLMAEANAVLAGGGPPVSTLAHYVALRAPSIAQTVAPLAGLLGALMALVVMARNSEILAMRAAGRSVMSLVGGLVAAGVVLSGLLFVFTEYVVVPGSASLQVWQDSGYKVGAETETGDTSWIVEGSTIIRVGQVMRDGAVLHDVHVFDQSPDAKITELITVRLAIWEDDHWTMFDVKRVGGDPDAPPPVWNTALKPEQFGRKDTRPSDLSMNALKEYVGNVAIGSRPPYFYETWLQQKFAGPIVLALMPLLAAIAAFAHHRQGSPVLIIVWGVTFGFMFIVVDNILLAMGQFGSLPPLLAAWLPVALFATVGMWVVFNFEHTGART